MELVIVTGLSGAGRHSVLEALEDRGFTALDILPVRMLDPLIELEGRLHPEANLAVGMDGRHEDFAAEFEPLVLRLQARSQPLRILFLEASDPVLLRRYSETRRVHHLAKTGATLGEAIDRERGLLAPIRALSTEVLDTSNLSLSELRQRLDDMLPHGKPRDIQMRLTSFGFKFGVPQDVDMVLDARFLPNPFYMQPLRGLTGRDEPVQKWLMDSEAFREFLAKSEAWLRWALPLLRLEGRAYHTVAIGCTGGQHRSVALVEMLAERLRGEIPDLQVRHRELNK